MNYCKIVLLIILSASLLPAQGPISQIEGFLEVHPPMDTTSIYVGKKSGQNINNTGAYNTFFGAFSGAANEGGAVNTFFGARSGLNNTSGQLNTFIGYDAGRDNDGSSWNTFVGSSAGLKTHSGFSNSFFGSSAGINNSTGGSNTYAGYRSGYNTTTGNSNSFFGNGAGENNITGGSNTMIGSNTDATTGFDNLNYAAAIGSGARVKTSNTLVLGRPADGAVIPGKLAIGQDVPSIEVGDFKLKVKGNTLFRGLLEVFHHEDSTSIYVGMESGRNVNNTFTGRNSFFGSYAGQENTLGQFNSFYGFYSGRNNTSGQENSFFGLSAGASNIDGNSNSFFGYLSGNGNLSGRSNAFYGSKSGQLNTLGKDNSFFGFSSGFFNISGTNNSFFGTESGINNTTGNYNSLFGFGANTAFNNLHNATAIGAEAQVSTDSTLVLGRPTDGVVAPGILVVGQDVPTVHHPEVRFMIMESNNPTLSIRAADNSSPKIQLTKDPTNSNSDWTIRMNVPGDDELLFRHHGNTRFEISDQGRVKIHVLGSAGTISLCRNVNNEIATCSSSIRYKKQVENYNSGLEIIEQLRPVSYIWKESDQPDLGFIAEEIAKIDERLITRNQKDEIEGVKYDRLTTILVNSIKEQQDLLEKQSEQINFLMNQIKSLTGKEYTKP